MKCTSESHMPVRKYRKKLCLKIFVYYIFFSLHLITFMYSILWMNCVVLLIVHSTELNTIFFSGLLGENSHFLIEYLYHQQHWNETDCEWIVLLSWINAWEQRNSIVCTSWIESMNVWPDHQKKSLRNAKWEKENRMCILYRSYKSPFSTKQINTKWANVWQNRS